MIRGGVSLSRFSRLLVAASVLWITHSSFGQAPDERQLSAPPGTDLFKQRTIPRIRIDLGPDAGASLKRHAREFVPATVTEGTNVYSRVGIHLKGSVGSFRPLDDKPSLTLDFSRFESRQRFHGLRKIHLNNSVEDPSYANEIIGSELFRAAGVPAPRVTRALVVLKGRAPGLYVLKEGFTEDFLACHFKRVSGELYEPEDGHDVDQKLKRNSVLAPAGDRAALQALAEAALEPDSARRWQRLQTVLDTDRFLKFMSLEIMLGHRDGYCLARNNFRVYHDLDTDKMVFFPHGMDQLLGTADFPWQPSLAGLVAKAVLTTPEGKASYTAAFGSLLTNVFKVNAWTNRVDQLAEELRPVLSGGEWNRVRDEASVVKERIVQRQLSLVSQLNQPALQPMEFEAGTGRLDGWVIAEAPPTVKLDQLKGPAEPPTLHIAATGEAAASWRTVALLKRGRYRFEGRVRIASVEPLPYGVHHGAGLRVRGSHRQMDSLTGDSPWRLLAADFQVEQPTEAVEFICELRARAGEAWFELTSLRVRQMGDL
jgi:spore coat protein H